MNCSDVSRSLVAYLDRRANSAERKEIETHLAACGDCRGRAEQFGALWRVLDEMPVMEPTFTFDARVRQRIAEQPVRSWFDWLMPQPRMALSAALLAVLCVWLVKTAPVQPMDGGPVAAVQQEGQQEDFNAIKNLDVLENYDVVTSMDALSQLTPAAAADANGSQRN